jgi:VWFA-related protein
MLASVVVLGASIAHAQQPGVNTLQLSTRIIVLDVVVTDKKGNLVNNLSKDDFTIVQDKVPQTIRSFEAPSAHVQPPAVTVHSTADLRQIGDAPVTILVLDELNTRFEDMSFARQSMTQYLQSQPAVLRQPTEMLIVTNTRFQLMHDFTQNRDELLDKVKHQPAEYPYKRMAGKGGPMAVERMAQSLASLEQIAQATAGTPGRKNVIWVGAGFPSVDTSTLDDRIAETILAAVRQCTNMLLASRITMYTIDPTLNSTATLYAETPEDLAAAETENGGDPSAGGVQFSTLAPATGGRAFLSRNDVNNEIAEGIAAGANYYTLSYRPTAVTGELALDPKQYHTVRIVMRDQDLRASTRDGYYAPTAATENVASVESAKQARAQIQLDLASAINSALAYNTLEVSAQRVGDAYLVRVKPRALDWRSADAQHEVAEATVVAAWYDAKGKLIGHSARELTSTRGTSAQAATADALFTLPVTLTGNPARLRIIVRDASSAKMGTVDLTP